ncbi:MAG: GDSL-type esterase/lipase family protein [Chloroflexi bacterium]|nr:GDSL-type esterase/lipase family protein [Chloroflexota bacterium]
MNKKATLLAIGVAIMVITAAGAFTVQTVQNQKSPAAPVRVACVGDSITEGSDYPSDLWMLLGSNYTVGNFGHGGTTVSLDAPTPYMRQAAFQEAKDFEPGIVVIMLGTNDALPSFQIYNATFVADYLELVGEFQALQSKPQIWLVLPPPILHNGTGLSTQFFSQNVIPNIEEAANRTNLPTINLYAALSNRPDCFPDGVHPNVEGSQLIANEVYKAIISK